MLFEERANSEESRLAQLFTFDFEEEREGREVRREGRVASHSSFRGCPATKGGGESAVN